MPLLTYVALAPKGVMPREQVAELLWPGCEFAESRHSLRQCLYRLVATYRPAELCPIARQFARSLYADRLADMLLLEGLSQDDIRDLLTTQATFESGDVEETVTRLLHRHTAGNPLFLNGC